MLELRLLGIIIALVALYMNNLNYKRKVLHFPEFLLWLSIWVTFMILCFLPNMFNIILSTFNIEYTFDLIIIIAFIVVYILCYKAYIDSKLIQHKMEMIVRKLALNEEDLD